MDPSEVWKRFASDFGVFPESISRLFSGFCSFALLGAASESLGELFLPVFWMNNYVTTFVIRLVKGRFVMNSKRT